MAGSVHMYMSVNRLGGGGGSVCLYMSVNRLGSAGCTGSGWYRASTFWGD